jgi:hypothetical protein
VCQNYTQCVWQNTTDEKCHGGSNIHPHPRNRSLVDLGTSTHALASLTPMTSAVAHQGASWATTSDSHEAASVGLAAGASTAGECTPTSFEHRNAYAIFGFCYQFGVLISRSSLQVYVIFFI